MNYTNLIIEPIQMSEIEEVANILTDAFETNPAYSLIFNKTHDLRKGLLWLFRANLLLLNRKQELTRVVKEKDSRKIIGTYTLIPPEGVKKSILTYFQIGIPQFVSAFGFRTLSKMMAMDNYNKKVLNDSIKANRYYYLSMVVVKAEYRGTGIGSYAIGQCLQNLSQISRNCDLLGLTTQLPENVVFYSKLGFEKIEEGKIVFKEDSYYNYNMKYTIKSQRER